MWKKIINDPAFGKKLKHPLVASWLLDRLTWYKEVNEDQATTWMRKFFKTSLVLEIIEKHLHTETLLFEQMLTYLPIECFRGLEDRLEAIIPSVQLSFAHPLLFSVLAQLAPETAYRLLTEQPPSPSPNPACIYKVIPFLTPDQAEHLLDKYMDLLCKDTAAEETMSWCIGKIWSWPVPSLHKLLSRKLAHIDAANTRCLSLLYPALTSELTFFDHFLDLFQEQNTTQTFQSLAWLFLDETPLDKIQTLCATEKNLLTRVLDFLHQYEPNDFQEPFAFFQQEARTLKKSWKPAEQTMVAYFLLALRLAQWLPKTWSFADLSLEDTIQRVSADIEYLPGLNELIAHINSFDAEKVSNLLLKQLAVSSSPYARKHLIRVMGALKRPEFVCPMIHCIDQDSLEFIENDVCRVLWRMGHTAEQEILGGWIDFEDTQKNTALEILKITASKDTAHFLLDTYADIDDMFSLEQWCSVAQSCATPTMLSFLAHELPKKRSIIDHTFVVLCYLVNPEHPKLASIENRLDKLDPFWDNNAEPSEDENESVTLELICKSCEKKGTYEVNHIFISTPSSDTKPYIGGDLVCTSCGQFSNFSLTTYGQFFVTRELLKMIASKDREKKYHGPVKIITMLVQGNKAVSPQQAIDFYKQNIQKDPNRVEEHLGLANCYDNFHHHQLAKNHYQTCLELDPACIEAAYKLATVLYAQDPDVLNTAIEILEKSLSHEKSWNFYRINHRTSKAEFIAEFKSFYNHLQQRKKDQENALALTAKVTKKPIKPKDITPDLAHIPSTPSSWGTFVSSITIKKGSQVGRNDPCPCGSGKKYKKCCLKEEG